MKLYTRFLQLSLGASFFFFGYAMAYLFMTGESVFYNHGEPLVQVNIYMSSDAIKK